MKAFCNATECVDHYILRYAGGTVRLPTGYLIAKPGG